MSGDIKPELVERMVVLVRRCAAKELSLPEVDALAVAIVAELPAPVDPDLIEARKIVASQYPPESKNAILAGVKDGGVVMAAALAAIKRGRELERGA